MTQFRRPHPITAQLRFVFAPELVQNSFKVNNAINPRDPLYRGELIPSGGTWPVYTEFAGMKCFDFNNGTSDHIGNFPALPQDPIQGAYVAYAGTLGAWVNLGSRAQHGSGCRIFGWCQGGTGIWTIGTEQNERIDLRWRGSFSPGSTSIQDDDWHFLCMTKRRDNDGSNVGHYLDGVLDHTSNSTSTLNHTPTDTFKIGGSGESARAFRGFVGPCYMWFDRELSAKEVQMIWNDPTLPYKHMLRRRMFVDSAPAPAGRIIGSRTIYSDGELQSALH